MKITWQDIIILMALIVFIVLPGLANNQIYDKGQASKDVFGKDIKEKKLFYPGIRTGNIPISPNSEAYYSVLVDPGSIDEDKILLEKNSSSPFPIASITKLMTAIVALDNYDLKDEIIITERDLNVEGNMGSLAVGQAFELKDLLYVMLIDSNNGAAEAIARKMGRDSFVKKMNLKAASLKLSKTKYYNPTGLDESGENVNTSSPKDLTSLTVKIMNDYPAVAEILGNQTYVIRDENGLIHDLENTNDMLSDDKKILWGKTGFTLIAKGCLILVTKHDNFSFFQKRYIITTVLGSDDRFDSMRRIRAWEDNKFIW